MFRRDSLTPLKITVSVISYARQYEGERFIIALNLDDNPDPDFEIDLGSQGISCSRFTNLLVDEDQNIRLNSSEANGTLLTVRLERWEPKILRDE